MLRSCSSLTCIYDTATSNGVYSIALRLFFTLSARLVSTCDIEPIVTGSSSVSSGAVFLARLLLEEAGVVVGVEHGVVSIRVEGDAGIP